MKTETPTAQRLARNQKRPLCQICQQTGARFDARTQSRKPIPLAGRRALMCAHCFNQYGIGLGTDYGQQLLIPGEKQEIDIVAQNREWGGCAVCYLTIDLTIIVLIKVTEHKYLVQNPDE